MSLSATIANAVSGLGATGRSAKAVSDNLANALTPGYGVRRAELQANRFGGVRVEATSRVSDPAVVGERRAAEASLSASDRRMSALQAVGRLLGDADSEAGLSARVSAFRAELVQTAAAPESDARLNSAVRSAGDLAQTLNAASNGIQAERKALDSEIGASVSRLNTGLAKIDKLNEDIAVNRGLGRDTAALEDMRQVAIDTVSELIPVREMPRANGRVALVTVGGSILLDDKPVKFGFVESTAMAPGSTGADLTIDGKSFDISDANSRLAGGRMTELFVLRDKILPEEQARLDGFAFELIERLRDPTLDTTSPEGLFVDGIPTSVPVESGIAGRIAVHPDLVSEQWRLRDGIGAPGGGDPGNSSLIAAIDDTLSAHTPPKSAVFDATPRSIGSLADGVSSKVHAARMAAEDTNVHDLARYDAVKTLELAGGVDSDSEMQSLLSIERAYAANARVLQAVDGMMQRLLEI